MQLKPGTMIRLVEAIHLTEKNLKIYSGLKIWKNAKISSSFSIYRLNNWVSEKLHSQYSSLHSQSYLTLTYAINPIFKVVTKITDIFPIIRIDEDRSCHKLLKTNITCIVITHSLIEAITLVIICKNWPQNKRKQVNNPGVKKKIK